MPNLDLVVLQPIWAIGDSMQSKKYAVLLATLLFLVGVKEVFADNTYSLDLEAGSSQYASIADASQTGLDLASDFTIEAWVNIESQPGSWPDARVIASKTSGNTGYEVIYWWDGNNYELGLIVGDGTLNEFDYTNASAILPTSVWKHVVFVFDASTKIELFIDGTSVWSTTSSIPSSVSTNATAFFVGERNGSGSAYMDGLVDEVRVWSVVRTHGEIASNYNKELTGSETNLQGYWKFNNDYQDSTANNNDLTSSGSPSFSANVPSFTALALLAVRKTADESVTSSTTLQDDNELILSLDPANTTYFVEGAVFAASSSDTPDIKIAFTVPSGATMDLAYISSRGSTFNHGELLESSGTTSITIPIDNTNVTVIMIRGTVKLSTTTGSLKLQWAQATSNATATTVKIGSFLSAEKH